MGNIVLTGPALTHNIFLEGKKWINLMSRRFAAAVPSTVATDNYDLAVASYIATTHRISPWPLIPEGTRRRLFAEIDEATGYKLSVWAIWDRVVAQVDTDFPWWFGGTKKADNQAARYRRAFNARVFGGVEEVLEDVAEEPA